MCLLNNWIEGRVQVELQNAKKKTLEKKKQFKQVNC